MQFNRGIFVVFSILSLALLSCPGADIFARDPSEDPALISKQQLKEQKEIIKSNSQAGRQEEKDLLDQIRQAEQSGDKETARSLRVQLRAMHEENVQQKQQDQQELKNARQEWRTEKKAALEEKMDFNDDGVVNKTERNYFWKQKADANQDGMVDNTERARLKDGRNKFHQNN